MLDPKRGWVCTMCGHEQEAERMQETRAAAPGPKDWIEAAQARLRGLLAELERIAQVQAEAERIHRALAAAEVKDLAPLPWKAAKAGNAAGPKRSRSWTCKRCGKKLYGGEMKQVGGVGTGCKENCPALVGAA